MPARLFSIIAVLSVAALLLLGGSTMRSVSAQLPPEVPDARMMRGNVKLTGNEQPVEEMKPLVVSEGMLENMPQAGDEGGDGCEQIPPGFFGPESPRLDFANPHFISSDPPVSEEMVLSATASPACGPPACGSPAYRPLGRRLGERLNFIPRLNNYIFNPPERHRDIGQPLTRESWRYRPFGLGLFVGYIGGGTLINNWTGADSGVLGGFRLSWDPGYYWGCEFRYATASMGQWDSLLAKDALLAATGTYNSHRDVNLDLWDFSLLWYPWGDTVWRPYALIGLGGSQVRFDDCFLEHWSQQEFAMPLALGLKYRYNSRLAFRFELADNIVFGSGRVSTMHHFAVTGNLEIRFGGHRKAYWPWSPGRYYW